MYFEWDENKNHLNIKRHEIDFADARSIFDYPFLKRVDNRKDYGEIRYVALGQLNNVIVSIVYTIRREIIRIISVRRANKRERQIYKTHISE